jgi:predicted nuclease of restriction endonuclease-like (RecB) superfamily
MVKASRVKSVSLLIICSVFKPKLKILPFLHTQIIFATGPLVETKEYNALLRELKEQLLTSRYRAALNVNKEMILLYHRIGTAILESQAQHGWGAKVIDQLSRDLKTLFPDMKGFSTRNLKYMRKLAEEYPDTEFVQQLVAQLPWGHNVILMDMCQSRQTRIFYMKATINNNWSRSRAYYSN